MNIINEHSYTCTYSSIQNAFLYIISEAVKKFVILLFANQSIAEFNIRYCYL